VTSREATNHRKANSSASQRRATSVSCRFVISERDKDNSYGVGDGMQQGLDKHDVHAIALRVAVQADRRSGHPRTVIIRYLVRVLDVRNDIGNTVAE